MGTREEPFERQCPFCGRKDMRERGAIYPCDDDYIRKEFKCTKCGHAVWVSSLSPVYKPLEELKAEWREIVLKLNDLYTKYYDLRDRTMSPTKEMGIVKEHINKLRKDLDKLNKKINKVRRERKENE